MKYLKIILQNIVKEYLVIIRKPAGLIFWIVLPFTILVVFGVSFPGGLLEIKVASVVILEDGNNQVLVDSVKERISSEYFSITIKKGDDSILRELVAGENYMLGIYPTMSGYDVKTFIVVDNSNPLAEGPVLNTLTNKLKGDRGVFVERINLYKEDFGFVGYLFPGIIAIGIMFISLNVASMGVIRERILGSLERILSAPSPLWLFLISKYLAYIVLASISGILVLAAGNILFNIPISGSIWLVILLEVFTALPFIGLALAASIIGKSEFESQAIANFIAIPLMFISGVFFPVQCMPNYIRTVAEILPLTFSVDALRDVIIKGLGYSDIIYAFGALSLYALLFFILVILIFRKRKK